MMSLPMLKAGETIIPYSELVKSLKKANTQSETLSAFSLLNKRISFDNLQIDIWNSLTHIQPSLFDVVKNIIHNYGKSFSMQEEVLALQNHIVRSFVQTSAKRLCNSNTAHQSRLKEFASLYSTPSSTSNGASIHIKPLKDIPPVDEVLLFQSSTYWIELNELSMRLLLHLATFYPDLYRTMIITAHSSYNHAIFLPTIATLVTNSILSILNSACSSKEIIPLLFDSPFVTEELFCAGIHMFHLFSAQKSQLTLLKVPAIIQKIQTRLKKIISKTTKVSEFKNYFQKTLKPPPAEPSNDLLSSLNKDNLIQRISSTDYADALEALDTLSTILEDEEKSLIISDDFLTDSIGLPKKKDSPKETSKHEESDGKKRKPHKSLKDDMKILGWASIRTHIPAIVQALYQASQYEHFSFLLPHILSDTRLLVNTLLWVLDTYTRRVMNGLADVDAAVRSIAKQTSSSAPLYSNFIEYVRLNNTTSALYALSIIVGAIGLDKALLPKLLAEDFIIHIPPHFSLPTSGQINVLEDLQTHIVDRIKEIHATQLNIEIKDHQRALNNLWNICFGETGKKLSSPISKQWYLLGFADENPTVQMKSKLPLHFMDYVGQTAPEKLEVLLGDRLLMRKDDYNFASVIMDLSEAVFSVVIASLAQNRILHVLFSHPYVIEECFVAALFGFEGWWSKKGYTDSSDNHKACLNFIKFLLLTLIPKSKTLAEFTSLFESEINDPKISVADGLVIPTALPTAYAARAKAHQIETRAAILAKVQNAIERAEQARLQILRNERQRSDTLQSIVNTYAPGEKLPKRRKETTDY